MLTLITGDPGTGKSALAVSMMLEEQGERPLFVMGISELKIPHEVAPPVAEWTKLVPLPEDPSIQRPVFQFPPNAILLVDEAQTVYRPRAAGSRVPDHVAAIETHRHTGIDIWLITQGVHLIDSNVRPLVGRHVHIRALPFGRKLYEWSECGDPKSKTSRDIAARRNYKLPKKVFGLYKSASLHVKVDKRMPTYVWVIGFSIVIALLLAFFAYRSINRKMHQGEQAQPSLTQPDRTPEVATTAQPAARPQADVTAVSIYEAEHPRIAGRPETAPLYDAQRSVKAMPMVVGYIASKGRCKAFTQQGTVVAMSNEQCLSEMEQPRYNPYLDQQVSPPQTTNIKTQQIEVKK
ncbi:zonular occludens toxin family protein [Chromobacterium haemolyticum]|uniref:zonular occludens toxin family protein n=1 Tax=Chromobacterium haemolyticum TaxID=394935 RepID=UPI0009DA85FB|nr:zonular occludens toxin domain-containing protein [Chromobacterium haemolyticum]OQS34742.1 hypothetical protein B0T39_19145 [Chromobacterium haemolyticum]